MMTLKFDAEGALKAMAALGQAADKALAEFQTDIRLRRIALLCEGCGNAKLTPRESSDPVEAVRLVTSCCDLCDRDNGAGYMDAQYENRAGQSIMPEGW